MSYGTSIPNGYRQAGGKRLSHAQQTAIYSSTSSAVASSAKPTKTTQSALVRPQAAEEQMLSDARDHCTDGRDHCFCLATLGAC